MSALSLRFGNTPWLDTTPSNNLAQPVAKTRGPCACHHLPDGGNVRGNHRDSPILFETRGEGRSLGSHHTMCYKSRGQYGVIPCEKSEKKMINFFFWIFELKSLKYKLF